MPYFAPNQPEFNYLRHLALPVWDGKQPLTKEELKYYVVHFNKQGKPTDWFFDSFLPLTSRAPSGNSFCADINRGTSRSGDGDFYAIPHSNPSNLRDWKEGLDQQFSPNGMPALIDEIIEEHKKKIGNLPEQKRNMVFTIPYPLLNQSMFGQLKPGKPSLNFSILGQNLMQATEQRLEACQWFVDQVIERWEKAKYRHSHLLGFYWVYESIHYSWELDDHWLLKELYKHIRRRKRKFFWIPFYSSYNVRVLNDYRGFYFDCAFLQPNHIFYNKIKAMVPSVEEAKERNAGVEIEYYYQLKFSHSVGKEKYRRFRNYLNGGIKYGYMKDSACAYFIGGKDLPVMYYSPLAPERDFYQDLYHFVKGDYQIKDK